MYSSVSMEQEFQHVQKWSAAAKLHLLVILSHHNLSLAFIEQVTVTKLFGIYIFPTFSTVTHVEHTLLLTVNECSLAYLLAQLKNQGYRVLLYMLYLLPSYCPLLCSSSIVYGAVVKRRLIKLGLMVCFAKLFGKVSVAKHLPLMSSQSAGNEALLLQS